MMQLTRPGVLRISTEDQRRSAAKRPNEPAVSKGGQAQRSDRRLVLPKQDLLRHYTSKLAIAECKVKGSSALLRLASLSGTEVTKANDAPQEP